MFSFPFVFEDSFKASRRAGGEKRGREGGSAGRAEVAVAFRGAAAERAALQPYLAALSAADDQAPPPEKTIDA